MPMYEFFCPPCNTIFTFFSKSIDTEKAPSCPKCNKNTLQRMVSRFAVTGKAKGKEGEGAGAEEGSGASGLPIDEARMEKAMEALAGQAERLDENNPRQAADFMRTFSSMTGLKLGDKMEDALARMEAGEDPEVIERELGDLNENDLFRTDALNGKSATVRTKSGRLKPLRDETLYDM